MYTSTSQCPGMEVAINILKPKYFRGGENGCVMWKQVKDKNMKI